MLCAAFAEVLITHLNYVRNQGSCGGLCGVYLDCREQFHDSRKHICEWGRVTMAAEALAAFPHVVLTSFRIQYLHPILVFLFGPASF